MIIYVICNPYHISFFENIGPQTEMVIFLKFLL